MSKLNAVLDSSFWINAHRGGLASYLSEYFAMFAPEVVAEEVEHRSTITGLLTAAGLLFRQWRLAGQIVIQNPEQSIDWFDPGENAAIALALERDYWLLMDNGNPYHMARSQGLRVVKTPDLAVFLFDIGELTYDETREIIHRLQVDKKLARSALITLERLVRLKGGGPSDVR